MVTSKEDCTCAHHCPDGACICIWDYEEERCSILCSHHTTPPKVVTAKAALDTQVRVEAIDVELADFGEFVAGLCGADLLIPAARASEKVNVHADYTTLGDVIASVGLVVG